MIRDGDDRYENQSICVGDERNNMNVSEARKALVVEKICRLSMKN